jgi:peptide/nickel transport system substrate-binding protein
MRYLVPAIVTSSLLLISGCGTSNRQPAASSADSTGVDYQSIQKKAETFVPVIGKRGGEMILSTFSDPKSFNPITATETSTSEFTSYMYEGLVKINGVTTLPEPNLAQSWDVSDDGLTWTFHLRPGMLWSDSVPISAYDAEFTLNDLVYNDNVNPNSSRDIFTIEGKKIATKALDSMTLQCVLPSPFAPFLRMMAQEILPKHAYQKYVRNGSFSNSLGIKTSPDSMVSSGPFKLDSYVSSQKLVLKRNPLYWQKDSAGNQLPYLDRIVYMIVQDQNAELLRFKSHEIDYLEARGEDYPGLKKDEPAGGYSVYRLGPSMGSNFVFFNQNTGINSKTGKSYVDPVKLSWFRDVRFRKAVAYAIDKESMIRIVMNGLGYPQWGPMTPTEGFFFNPDVPQYPYSPDSARAILARAGFRDVNSDSILEDSAGRRVEFSFVTNSGNTVRVRIAEMIRKDLERIGFKVNFQQLEFNALIQKIDNPPFDWDAILLGLTGGVEPHFGKNVWASNGSVHLWFPYQKKPSTPWEASIDSIFNAAVKILDDKQRKVLYDRWQSIVADELPLNYTVLAERIFCLSNKFTNINPSPNGGILHNYERIFVK